MREILYCLMAGIIWSFLLEKNEEEHVKYLQEVLRKVAEAGLHLKLSRFNFFQVPAKYIHH